jgi:hypothetical protein
MIPTVKSFILLFSFLFIFKGEAYPGEPVTFCAAGDVLLDRGCSMMIRRHGYYYLFDNVRGFIQKRDIALCNLEGPLSSRKKTIIEKCVSVGILHMWKF